MRIYVLGSGSTGNAVLVEAAGTRILVDAGLGPVVCQKRLRALGVDLFPRSVDALVVTHEHADHAAHLHPLAKALRCPLVLHPGIAAPAIRNKYEILALGPAGVLVGGARIEAMEIPHDAPNVAVRIASETGVLAYATDLGHVPRGLDSFLAASDVAMLESNHCRRRLAEGPYPEKLRRRISGGLGHLSNHEAGDLVAAMGRHGDPLVALCHLSLANNDPDVAIVQVRERAPRARLTVLEHGTPEVLDVVRATRRGQVQLAFGF